MDNDKLIAIAIASGMGALLKELFGLMIRSSASVAKKLIAALPKVIANHLTLFHVLFNMIVFFGFAFVFFMLEPDPKTHVVRISDIRFFVILGLALVMTGGALWKSVKWLIEEMKSENKA
jgi:hypothetical protein